MLRTPRYFVQNWISITSIHAIAARPARPTAMTNRKKKNRKKLAENKQWLAQTSKWLFCWLMAGSQMKAKYPSMARSQPDTTAERNEKFYLRNVNIGTRQRICRQSVFWLCVAVWHPKAITNRVRARKPSALAKIGKQNQSARAAPAFVDMKAKWIEAELCVAFGRPKSPCGGGGGSGVIVLSPQQKYIICTLPRHTTAMKSAGWLKRTIAIRFEVRNLCELVFIVL